MAPRGAQHLGPHGLALRQVTCLAGRELLPVICREVLQCPLSRQVWVTHS